MSVHVRIVTNRALILDTVADEVRAPGLLGEFGVLPQHEQYLTLVRPGRVLVTRAQQEQGYIVGMGFAEAGPDRLTILTDYCEPFSAQDREKYLVKLREADAVLAASADGSTEWLLAEREAQIARAWLQLP
jgi:F-type H+-transporting ATPase subunit epsilon